LRKPIKHKESAVPQEGDYVCVRSRDQGVVFGILVWKAGRECRLKDARQLYNWGKKSLTLFDLCGKGPKASAAQISESVPEIDMTEICGAILVPEKMVREWQSFPATEV
jgi:hypothetical protein